MIDRSTFVVLGLDPSTKACGWTVGTLDGVVTDSGAIIPPLKMEPALRVFHVAQEVGKLYLKHRPSLVYSESPFVYENPQTTILLAGMGAVIHYVIWVASGRKLHVNVLQPDEARRIIGVPAPKRERDPDGKLVKLPKGAKKKNALKFITALMDDMGLPYSAEKKWPLGEEDRIESIGIFWAGCREFSRGLDITHDM